MNKIFETTTLAGGCFWCTEAIFKRLKGVISVLPGYSGGYIENPTYQQISSGKTGHVEAVQIEFDPKIISFRKILEIFWNTHNPTTINQQGNDFGPQYRSVIFYHNDKQKKTAIKSKIEFEKENIYKEKIVTEIISFTNFYEAEDYHKNYFENNKTAPYCNIVINPKINNLMKKYSDDLKKEYKL